MNPQKFQERLNNIDTEIKNLQQEVTQKSAYLNQLIGHKNECTYWLELSSQKQEISHGETDSSSSQENPQI